MPKNAYRTLLGLTVCGFTAGAAHGGPPLTIDDPGILDPGTFEVIVAAASESRGSGDVFLLPILDVSYGWSDNIQIAATVTRIVNDPQGDAQKSDVGPAALGLKWRFLDLDRLQMSVAPLFAFLPRDGAADRGAAEDVNVWGLPVQFQYQLAQWRLNAEAGYELVHGESDAWRYGVAAAYPLTERLELLAEVMHNTDVGFDERATGYLFGVDFALNEALHVLASAGAAVHESGNDDEDLRTYLGLQWFP